MATYYDPKQASNVFSVYAQQYKTEQLKEEEKKEKKKGYIKAALTPVKMAEANRATQIAEARLLQMTRDPDSKTGFKYEVDDAPREKGLRGWLKHRYAKPEDRVKLTERTPEAQARIAETEQLSQLSDPDFRHGEFDPVAYQKKLDKRAEEFRKIQKGGMKLERDAYYSSPELKAKEARRKVMKDITEDARLNKIESDEYRQYKKGLESMPTEQAQLQLGIVDSTKPQSPGMESVAVTDEFGFSGRTPKYQPTQGFNISAEERDALVASKLKDYDFESPGVSESQLAGRIPGSRQRLTPETNPLVENMLMAKEELGRADVRLGNLEQHKIDLLEGAESDLSSYPVSGSSGLFKGSPTLRTGIYDRPRPKVDDSYWNTYMKGQSEPNIVPGDKEITTKEVNIGKDTSDALPPYKRTDASIYGREGYETQQVLKGNYAVDTSQSDLPEAVKGRMGKELVEKTILEDNMPSSTYDSFGDLIKARDSAEKGSVLYEGLQGQVNKLFKEGGGTYEGASKVFGTMDSASKDALGGVDVGKGLEAATEGAESATSIPVPGLGTAAKAYQVGSVLFDKDASPDDQARAIGEMGLNYATGGLYGVGKGLYGLLGGDLA